MLEGMVALREEGRIGSVGLGMNCNDEPHQGVPGEVLRLLRGAPRGTFDNACLAGGLDGAPALFRSCLLASAELLILIHFSRPVLLRCVSVLFARPRGYLHVFLAFSFGAWSEEGRENASGRKAATLIRPRTKIQHARKHAHTNQTMRRAGGISFRRGGTSASRSAGPVESTCTSQASTQAACSSAATPTRTDPRRRRLWRGGTGGRRSRKDAGCRCRRSPSRFARCQPACPGS
jgi:hypothetical protein